MNNPPSNKINPPSSNFIHECSEVMPALQKAINAITPQQMDRVGTKLGAIQPNEKVVGTLHSELARRLWVLHNHYHIKGTQIGVSSRMAETDEQQQEAEGEAKKFLAMANIAEGMFWYEVRESMSCWLGNCGVRKDWTVVTPPEGDDDDIPPIIRKLMGGMGGQ